MNHTLTNVLSFSKKARVGIAGALVFAFVFALVFLNPSTAFALNTISSTMRVGSRGADVTSLQTFLAMDSGIYPQGLVTGYFGSLTRAAVIQFQIRYSLGADGIVGPITRQRINDFVINGGFGGGVPSGTSAAPMIFNTTNSGAVNSDNNSSRATVSWQTNEASRGKVFYSSTPLSFVEVSDPTSEPFISGTVAVDGTFNTSKSLTLDNL